MARPNREYPVPQLYPLDGRFKLRWYAAKKPYQISLGNMSKAEAQVICTASAAAFAGRADFPDEICDEPALKRYLLTRDNISAQNNDEALIRLYYEHMKAKGGSLWANTARCYLKSALAFIGTLHNAK